MTLDEIINSLFGSRHAFAVNSGVLKGTASFPQGRMLHVLGICDGIEVGIDQAIGLAGSVLEIASSEGDETLLLLIDSSSQRMSRRDELLGLNEYLAHLAKALLFASHCGHRTIGLLYGGSAAGAFIATALACNTLVALPGAHPAVMDLPSMARVTKLPLDVLKAKAQKTAVFAPGLDNLARTGAIHHLLDADAPLAPQLQALLEVRTSRDVRDRLGRDSGGRPKAFDIARDVIALAERHG